MSLGKYFAVGEFDCKDGTPYPTALITERLVPLVETLDVIREAWGSPLTVISGYRSPAYNTRIGGARQSQHMLGTAADIRPKAGWSPQKLHDVILELYQAGKLPDLGGLGAYPTFVHVDVRPRANNRLARWSGSRSDS